MGEKVNTGVVLVSQFVPAGSSVFSGYIDYIDRDIATRNSNAQKYMISSLNNDILQYNEYMGYMDNPEKTRELFTADKDQLTVPEKEVLKKAFSIAQDNGSVMWQSVISFDNRWLEQNGLYDSRSRAVDEPALRNITRQSVDAMLKNEGILNTSVWSAAVHYNTDNLHIHIAIVEPQPTTEIIQEGEYAGQRKGKWKKDTLKAGKSKVVNNILNNSANYTLINSLKKDITQPARQEQLIMNAEMLSSYLDILRQLPKDRRLWKYNMNGLKKVRPQIDSFVERWLEENHLEDFKKLKKSLIQQQAIYVEAYGGEENNHYTENQIAALYSSLGNVVLQSCKTFSFEDLHENEFEKTIAYESEKVFVHLENEEYDRFKTGDFNGHQTQTTDEDIDPVFELEQTADVPAVLPDFIEDGDIDSFFDSTLIYQMKFSDTYKKAKAAMYGNADKKPDFSKAHRLLMAELEEGNAYAAHDLGYLYSKGLGCQLNLDISQRFYKRALDEFVSFSKNNAFNDAAEKAVAYADYRIGKMYLNGLGTEKDEEEAFHYFDQSECMGNLYAAYSLADFYMKGVVRHVDATEAYRLYHLVSEATQMEKCTMPYAVYREAEMLMKGQGVAQNTENATRLFETALQLFQQAERKQPDDKLQYRIGKMYRDGVGTEKDMVQAENYFVLSAALGNSFAQYTLADIYLKQNDTEKTKEAIQLLTVSAEKGKNVFSQYKLGAIFCDNKSAFFDTEKAKKYLLMAAGNGNQFAQYKLGQLYLTGEIVEANPAKALDYFIQSADQSNQFAQYKLGTIYLAGELAEKDTEKALRYFMLSADQGNQFAQYKLGAIYLAGEIVEKDTEKAMQYFVQSADQGNQFAEYKLGSIYLAGNIMELNAEKAIDYLSKSAEQGNQFAQYKLGSIFLEGKLVEANPEQALDYLQKAAEQGNQIASYQLGAIYCEGKFVAADMEKALNYFNEAVADGNQFIQYKMGVLYLDGKLLPADTNKAIDFLKQSATQGNHFAQYKLGSIYLAGEIVEANHGVALDYLYQSVAQGNQFAQYRLGVLHLEGKVVTADISKAFSFLKQSAAQGSQFAQYKLGSIYLDGKVVQANHEKALHYLCQSAAQGNHQAQYKMGMLYLEGKVIPADADKALDLLKSSAAQDNAFALYQLGVIYCEGKYLAPDIEKSLEYFNEAVADGNQFIQYKMGLLYLDGKLLPADTNKALDFLKQSAAQGNQFAQYKLGSLYLDGKFVAQDPKVALDYLYQSAGQENPYAQYRLGMVYLEGKFVTADPLQGLQYLLNAANQDHEFAQYQLGLLYLKGELVEADYEKAFGYFKQSADQDNQFAEYQLGLLYKKGEIVNQDITTAISYFEKAVLQDNHFAMYQLGQLYYYGVEGQLEPDKEKGLDYLTKSAEMGNEYAVSSLDRINNPKKFFSRQQGAFLNNHLINLFRQLGKEYKDSDYMRNEYEYEKLQQKIENEQEHEEEV